MTKDNDDNISKSANAVWHDVKSAMSNIFQRELTPQEFYYLLSLYPYLEICDVDYPYFDEGITPTISTAKNGWKIVDFGSVLCSGAYELFCRPKVGVEQDEEGEGGHGTIVQQYTDVAFQLIELAIKKGWTGAEIISGFYPMQRMAWIASMEKSYLLKGFDPTPEDYVVQNWVKQIRTQKLYPPARPFMVGKGLKR